MLTNARYFAKLSQENDTVQEVALCQDNNFHRDYKALRVFGEGLGNLGALQVLTLSFRKSEPYRYETSDDLAEREVVDDSLYWQAFAGALGRVQHHIELRLDCCGRTSFTNLAQTIQGVSTIHTFHSGYTIPCDLAKALMSTLASLPSLENVTLGFLGEEALDVEFPELTNLLKSPSLRFIEFSEMHFVSGLSRALQTAFEEGSFVTDLRFTDCYTWISRDDETAIHYALVQILQRNNSSLKTLSVIRNDFGEVLFSLITSALLFNTSLLDLAIQNEEGEKGGRWLRLLFVTMRINTSLKSLEVNDFYLTDELVCESLRDMLAKNSVLESLTLHSPESLDETGVVSWRKNLPFIWETLKSLTISFKGVALDPHVATVCFDTVAMLEEDTTLECLDVKSGGISLDAYFAALESLQPSSALTTLRLSPVLASMGVQEMKQVVSLIKKS
jgi:hypothetical protein